MEPGMPFEPGASGVRARLEAALLVVCLRRFGRVTLLVCGDLDVDESVLRRLWPVAQEVVVSSDDEAEFAARRFGVPRGSVVVKRVCGRARGEVVLPGESDGSDNSVDERRGENVVTVSGPPEWASDERARHLVAVVEDAARKAMRAAARIVRMTRGPLGPEAGRTQKVR
jgi:hypothetical protein